MRFPRLMLAASGLATVALLASSAAANAATINGPIYNTGMAGYQVQSSVPFNEVRTTVHIPAGAESSSWIDLQESTNGGKTFALGLLFNPNTGGYYLASIQGIALNGLNTGLPLPTQIFAPNFKFVSTLGTPAGQPLFNSQSGGSYFLEIHYSTKRHLVQFVAGPSETDAATLSATGSGFLFTGQFSAPAVETLNLTSLFGQGATLPISAPQASFTRTGLTEPAGHNVGGIAGTRITFDFFALNEAVATTGGGAPTIATNAITLEPSPALPGVGSAFGIVTGPKA